MKDLYSVKIRVAVTDKVWKKLSDEELSDLADSAADAVTELDFDTIIRDAMDATNDKRIAIVVE